jgi:hypothetical protein
MVHMQQDSDDQIDEFLRSLPPAPERWVARAEEMPLLERAIALMREQRVVNGDEKGMRAALKAVGLDPDERRLRALARLRALRNGSD